MSEMLMPALLLKSRPESFNPSGPKVRLQYNRVPTTSRDIRATYAKLIEELWRVSFANVERAKAVLEQCARETGEPVTVTPESMVEAVPGKHFEIVATEVTFLRNMIEQSVKLSRLLGKLDWEILVASDGTGFLLCDCPVVIVPPKGSKRSRLSHSRLRKIFPVDARSLFAAWRTGTVPQDQKGGQGSRPHHQSEHRGELGALHHGTVAGST